MTSKGRGWFATNRPQHTGLRLPLVIVGLCLLVAGFNACGQAGQVGVTETKTGVSDPEPSKSVDLVRPVGLQQTVGPYVPESVSISDDAERFSPPAEMFVYEITPTQPATREAMDALATNLGIGERSRVYGEEGLSGPGGSLTCRRADDVTCFYFIDTVPGDAAFQAILVGSPPEPPSDEETRAAADAYLESLGMKDGYDFLDIREASVYGTIGPSGEDQRWVVEMRARYQAYVDGVPLTGPGSRVEVHVGPAGSITAFYHLAQKAQKTEYAVTIRPISAALQDLRAGKGEVPANLDNERDKSITIESIALYYYAPPCATEEMYYKPVYVFSVRGGDGTLGDWVLDAFEGSTAEGAI